MASQDPKTFLWSNIALLMGTGSPTVDAVQRKTQVGRGTVQRIKEGSTSTGTDTLLAIADAFGVEPWELLQPQLGKKTATLDANKATSPTLAQAMEVVALEVGRLPPLVQSAGRDALTKWAAGNASAEQTAAVLAALAQAAAKLPAMGAALAETPVPRPAKHET